MLWYVVSTLNKSQKSYTKIVACIFQLLAHHERVKYFTTFLVVVVIITSALQRAIQRRVRMVERNPLDQSSTKRTRVQGPPHRRRGAILRLSWRDPSIDCSQENGYHKKNVDMLSKRCRNYGRDYYLLPSQCHYQQFLRRRLEISLWPTVVLPIITIRGADQHYYETWGIQQTSFPKVHQSCVSSLLPTTMKHAFMSWNKLKEWWSSRKEPLRTKRKCMTVIIRTWNKKYVSEWSCVAHNRHNATIDCW